MVEASGLPGGDITASRLGGGDMKPPVTDRDRLFALPEPRRSWAVERAAIYIFDAGMTPAEADRQALADEQDQRQLGGVR
jgi:hypothetical protein